MATKMPFPSLSHQILPIFFFIIVILLQYHSIPCLATRTLRNNNGNNDGENPNTDFIIRKSCNTTLYPELCYSTFSNFSNQITETNPKRELACLALNMTLSEAQRASAMAKSISKGNVTKGKRQAYARKDCMEMLKDSIDELRMSVEEMERANPEDFNFRFRVNNVQTWVSAALTDEDTCMDGLKEGGGNRSENFKRVRDEVVKVAHLTSIALALINNYAASC